jgi:uncharacterized protein (DUF305 family)
VKKYTRYAGIPIALIVVVALLAQAQGSHRHTADDDQEKDWSELTASMEKMHRAMGSIEPSGNSDVDFVMLMLPHHQAAIDMAKTQLVYGKDPQMRRLAQEIITDQQSEIELMRLWLTQHRPGSSKDDQAPNPGEGKEQ